jgi:molybdopterin-binding protein
MKISARNVFKGKIIDVTKGATTAHVKIDIGGIIVTSSITNTAVDDLKLAPGKDGIRSGQSFRCHDRDRRIGRLCDSQSPIPSSRPIVCHAECLRLLAHLAGESSNQIFDLVGQWNDAQAENLAVSGTAAERIPRLA